MTVNDFHQQPEAFAPRRAWLADIYAPHVNFVARMSTPGGHGADWGDTHTTKWVPTAESAPREAQALPPYRPDNTKALADCWRHGQVPEDYQLKFDTPPPPPTNAHQHHTNNSPT